MNPPPENHEQLLNLLAIKRHEQPPPGYFVSFSHQVISRIEAQCSQRVPWWRQWFAELTEQPLLASTYGLLFAGLLVIAAGLAQSSTGSEPEIAVPPFSPIGSYYSLSEDPLPYEPLPRATSHASTSPVLMPFFGPLGPVDRAAYRP
jgi:hypothetical protein